jgi:beta-ribofuranosylaminobenzene 5'-phosphate synthase
MTSTQPRPGSRPFAVEVRTPARLHLGMMSFGVPEVRSFGGVGVMIDRPGVLLRMERADRLTARGPLAERAIQFAESCGRAWGLAEPPACVIDVALVPRSHVGLGSGTQLGLAVAAGVRHLFLRRPAADEPRPAEERAVERERLDPGERTWSFDTSDAIALARAAGRGRRSCVGIYGFSRGGLIIEGGRRVARGTAQENDATRDFSPMVARVRLPSAWRCVVVVQRDSIGLHGEAEKQAFASLPPVPLEISAELARIAVMDLLPAAVEGRFDEFSDAVFRYGLLAGKPFEQASSRLPHAGSAAQLVELLGELGVRGAAQSSWGPAVMACCESLDAAAALCERFESLGLAQQYETIIAQFDTQGAVLRELLPDQARGSDRP